MITREAFLVKTQRRYKEFVFDGETYRIQSMTERERADYELSLQNKKQGKIDWERARRLFVCRILVDESGNRLLSDEDEALLQPIDGKLIGLLYSEGQSHCGYDRDEVEALVKN